MKVISLFKTKTFWGTALLFASVCLPEVRAAIADQDISIDDLMSIAIALVGTSLSLIGRMDAHGKVAYTPEGLPGRDEDVAVRLADR